MQNAAENQSGDKAASAVPVLGTTDGDLPLPIVTAQNQGDNVLVQWSFQRSAEPMYRLQVNVVNVVGTKFDKSAINSDIRSVRTESGHLRVIKV